MPTRPKLFRPPQQPPKPVRDRVYDERRGKTAERGYDAAWQRARAAHLAEHPLCEYCARGAWGEKPRTTAATLVDHIVPHRGDRALFWFRPWWASCCAACHSGPKQAAEGRGWSALIRLLTLLGRPTSRA